ncbi:response regulator [bacterium D16-51]|nr:response regulator [bacterium D16-59]RKI61525.1 response regulator [bacterium D16-51]
MEATGYLELTIVFVTLIFSVISIAGSVVFRLYYHRKIDLEYLGWGILLSAIWNLTNSHAGQALFRNSPAVTDIAFFIMLLLPLPFLFYMDEVQRGRYHSWYRIAEILLAVECIVFSGMNYFQLRDFADNILPIMACFLLFVLVVAGTILSDIFHGYIREYFVVAAGMICIWSAILVRIVSYIQRGSVKSDAVLPAGLIVLLVLASANTVTRLVNMERKRQQALMASEAKGKFLANMSHEIRTPINAVLGMNEMILRECTDAAVREYALDIQNAGQSLLALVNDILDLSKIESGKLEVLPEEYDLSSLLHDIMNMITMKAKDKGLAVELSVDENLPSRFWGDDIRLRQILVNIMNNAVKYTEKGSVTLTVTGTEAVTDSVSQSGSENSMPPKDAVCLLTFQVKDTGIGIRQEDLAKLFQEFQRIEEDRNRNIEGTGLGMSITTQLLELMGSKLEVESVYGKGSAFYFTLEQKVMDTAPIGNLGERIKKRAAEYSYQAVFTAPDARVLVVDDNSVNRKVFTNLLKATKVVIDEAAGGMECIRLAGEKQYDVIFLDHMMPDLNGIETLHRLRKLENCPCHAAPVIALTANAVSGAKEMYLKEGFDGFLSKPIIPDKLEKMLMQMLPENKVVYEETADDSLEGMDSFGKTEMRQPGENGKAEDFPPLDGIDWEYALMHLKDADILKDTVEQFYLAMDREAEDLEQFFQMVSETSGEQQKKAMEQYEVKVHAMKSNSAMIGAVPLSGVAKMLEYAARDGETEVLLVVTPVFLNEWKKMKTILGNCVDSGREDDAAGGLPADWNEVVQGLRQIVDAMKDMDIDTADESMGQIKKYQFPEQMKPLVDQLSLAVLDIDVVQAEERVEELVKMIGNYK